MGKQAPSLHGKILWVDPRFNWDVVSRLVPPMNEAMIQVPSSDSQYYKAENGQQSTYMSGVGRLICASGTSRIHCIAVGSALASMKDAIVPVIVGRI